MLRSDLKRLLNEVKSKKMSGTRGGCQTEQTTSLILSRSVSRHCAVAYPFISEMLRINLTGSLVHSEILLGITIDRCHPIFVASFKNKNTFLRPAGTSKGKNNDFSQIFMLDEGGYAGLHENQE